MTAVYERVRRLACSDIAILVIGETGAGKDHVAGALHQWSRRASRPFVVLNCAALPDALIESELFGHRKGAFTGATEGKLGLLAAAAGGTLFLDEIGELPPAAQAKLLRALEGGRFRPVGEIAERTTNVRLVAATNRDLEQLRRTGAFREDLFFRLGGAVVEVPPLRERPHDILPLARHFLRCACANLRRPQVELSEGACVLLREHAWDGNVRELKNLMELAAATCPEPRIEAGHVAPELERRRRAEATLLIGEHPPAFRSLADEINALERRRIVEALEAANGVQVRAAGLIGMPLRTFSSKLRKHAISIEKSCWHSKRTVPGPSPARNGRTDGRRE